MNRGVMERIARNRSHRGLLVQFGVLPSRLFYSLCYRPDCFAHTIVVLVAVFVVPSSWWFHSLRACESRGAITSQVADQDEHDSAGAMRMIAR